MNLIKETTEKELYSVVLFIRCFEKFGNFTRIIGGEGFHVFRKAFFKKSVTNSSF